VLTTEGHPIRVDAVRQRRPPQPPRHRTAITLATHPSYAGPNLQLALQIARGGTVFKDGAPAGRCPDPNGAGSAAPKPRSDPAPVPRAVPTEGSPGSLGNADRGALLLAIKELLGSGTLAALGGASVVSVVLEDVAPEGATATGSGEDLQEALLGGGTMAVLEAVQGAYPAQVEDAGSRSGPATPCADGGAPAGGSRESLDAVPEGPENAVPCVNSGSVQWYSDWGLVSSGVSALDARVCPVPPGDRAPGVPEVQSLCHILDRWPDHSCRRDRDCGVDGDTCRKRRCTQFRFCQAV
jgi:hypothetical protein